MPRLIFINRVCWPQEEATAQLLIDLVDGLAHLGWDCHVISGSKGGAERPGNLVTFHQLTDNGSRTSRGLISKALAYRRFTRSVIAFLPSFLRPQDRVIVMTDPPLIGSKVACVVQRNRAQLWHWTQDIYPEVAMAIGQNPLLRFGLRRLLPARDRAWEAAEQIITIGEDMAQTIRARSSSPISILPNWYPRGTGETLNVDFRKNWKIAKAPLLVIYSGNLGRAHTLEPIVLLAQKCQAIKAPVRFVFVGSGAQKDTLRNQARSSQLTNVSFESAVPRDQLDSLLKTADVHLVTMRPDCRGTVVPSKFYGIIAAGRPCIFIGPKEGDLPAQIIQNSLGIVCSPTDVSPAVSYLGALAENATKLAEACRSVQAYGATLPDAEESARAWDHVLRKHVNPSS